MSDVAPVRGWIAIARASAGPAHGRVWAVTARRALRLPPWLVALAIFVALYGGVALTEAALDARRDRFDLDGDGCFTGVEITPALQTALQAKAANMGRTFPNLTGLVLAAGAALFWAVACNLFGRGRR